MVQNLVDALPVATRQMLSDGEHKMVTGVGPSRLACYLTRLGQVAGTKINREELKYSRGSRAYSLFSAAPRPPLKPLAPLLSPLKPLPLGRPSPRPLNPPLGASAPSPSPPSSSPPRLPRKPPRNPPLKYRIKNTGANKLVDAWLD